MKLTCPFCPAEIEPKTTKCPSCHTRYDFDTLKFLRILVRESSKNDSDDRRKELRVPITLKVSYSTPKEFVDDYLYNLSLGGLFVKTNKLLNRGETSSLKIFLPDTEKELDVEGEVVWVRGEEETAEGKLPAGMGLKFIALSKEARERIIRVLSRALGDIQSLSAAC